MGLAHRVLIGIEYALHLNSRASRGVLRLHCSAEPSFYKLDKKRIPMVACPFVALFAIRFAVKLVAGSDGAGLLRVEDCVPVACA